MPIGRIIFALPCAGALTALVVMFGATNVQADIGDAVPRPNIIYLMTDDQRADALGCMGNEIIQTPNIDRLAARGVIFDNAFVTTAICATNRACVFTGQYAARHGIWRFSSSLSDEQLEQTYPILLREAGYHTGFVGKWGVGSPPREAFDFARHTWAQFEQTRENGSYVHLTQLLGEQAIEFLDEAAEQDAPFALSISFKAPHVQDPNRFIHDRALSDLYADDVIPPPVLCEPEFFEALPDFLRQSENRSRWNGRFASPEQYQESVKSYYRLITGVDNVVGHILERLDDLGLAGNTIIIYTSDHGFYLGERGFAGKWYPHELSIRIPLIVHDPRSEQQQGTRRDQATLSIDMAPTILDLAGVDIPESMQGVSLVPIIEGETPDWRDEFYYEHHFAHSTIPQSDGVRTSRWKYIRFINTEPLYEELYDLSKDLDEEFNLAGNAEFEAVLLEMREKWSQWRERVQ